jgi:cupin fold WbuC family metalloprotein
MSDSQLAFSNAQGSWYGLTERDVQRGLEASRNAPRKRFILPIHRTQGASVQRMINFLQPGTYLRPHKHPRLGAIETIVVLKGSVRFLVYDDDGVIIHATVLVAGTERCLVDIEDNVWHSFDVIDADTIIFECKMGPYDVIQDKVFASWSEPETF